MALVLSKEAAERSRKGRLRIFSSAMERLVDALNDEGAELETGDIYALCQLACDRHLGVPAQPTRNRMWQQALRKITSVIAEQSKRLNSVLNTLDAEFNRCHDQTMLEIAASLEKKGITSDDFERVMNGFAEVVNELSKNRLPPAKQGNIKGVESDYRLICWAALGRRGLTMRAASRIIARLLHDSTDEALASSIYQTIRDGQIGRE